MRLHPPTMARIVNAENALLYFTDCAAATLEHEAGKSKVQVQVTLRHAAIAVDMLLQCRRFSCSAKSVERRVQDGLQLAWQKLGKQEIHDLIEKVGT